MPDQAYFNLTLDTTSPSCSLTLGTNGFINSPSGVLGISSAAEDVAQMKVWGIMGTFTKSFTGDGSETEFTLDSPYPSQISSVTIAGSSTDQYTYTSGTGKITFNSAPASSAEIVVTWSDVLTEETASWETFATTKNIVLPEGDGSKTVYAKVRDDVYNESSQASVTVTLDYTIPSVTITNGPTPNKISKVTGKNIAQFTFQASEAIVEYKVCVVESTSSVQSAGVTIGTANGSENTSGTGSWAVNTSITVTITGADLEAASAGDGVKIVKVFVKDTSNNWST